MHRASPNPSSAAITVTPDHSSTDQARVRARFRMAKYDSHITTGVAAAHRRIGHGRSGPGRIRR